MINSEIGIFHFMTLSFILFITGLFGIIISKNIVKILFSVIIILNSICINFVAISRFCDGTKIEGETFSLYIAIISLVYFIIFVSLVIHYNQSNKKDGIEE